MTSIRTLTSAFEKERTYLYCISTDAYLGTMTLGLGFKGTSHPETISKERCNKFSKENNLKFYKHGMHIGSFCIPKYLRDMVGIDTN